jgi:hypothetical protein
LSDAEFYGFAMPSSSKQKMSVLFQNDNGHTTSSKRPPPVRLYHAINNFDSPSDRNEETFDQRNAGTSNINININLPTIQPPQEQEYQGFISWLMMTSNR